MLSRLLYLIGSYDGRIGRRTFWLALVLVFILGFMIQIIGAVGDIFARRTLEYNFVDVVRAYPAILDVHLFTWLAVAVAWYLQLSVIVKRLHDRNKRALWLWLAQVPVIGQIWLLVEAGFLGGTRGPNEWGDDPRDRRKAKAPASN